MSNADPTPEKPVEDWVTGDEPMTGPQRSYLQTLAREAGEELPEILSKAEASKLIDRLQQVTGRGESDDADRAGRNESNPYPSVDEITEEGIVDQQAAAEVPPAASGDDRDE